MADTATIEELQAAVQDGTTKLEEAIKSFEGLRSKGSASDLVKAGGALTSLERALGKAQFELDTFALVGVYTSIKNAVVKASANWDVRSLVEHDIATIRIDMPLGEGGVIDPEKVVVNTLGKKTVIRTGTGGGGGGRAKYEMKNDNTGETLAPRAFLEQFGQEALGDIAGKVLAEPQRYGLVDYATRAGVKLGWTKVEISS